MSRMRSGLNILRTILALSLLAWVAHRVNLDHLADYPWRKIDFSWLIAALLLGGLSLLGWAWRWWWFCRVYELRPSFSRLLCLTFYADFFNLYFLGPLGADGVRLLHLGRDHPEKRGAVLGSLLLDHVGGLAGGMILYLCFSNSGNLPQTALDAVNLALPWVGCVTFLGLGVLMEPTIQRLLEHIPGLSKITRWMSPVFAGSFRHPWLFSGIAVSVASTSCAFAAYWAAARAVGSQTSLPLILGIMPVVDMAASLPVTPGGVGVREGLWVELLGNQPGSSPPQAFVASLLGFAAIGIWGAVGGFWLLCTSTAPRQIS